MEVSALVEREQGCFVNSAQTGAGHILWFWLVDREDVKLRTAKRRKGAGSYSSVS
jgi:hypothetical protein